MRTHVEKISKFESLELCNTEKFNEIFINSKLNTEYEDIEILDVVNISDRVTRRLLADGKIIYHRFYPNSVDLQSSKKPTVKKKLIRYIIEKEGKKHTLSSNKRVSEFLNCSTIDVRKAIQNGTLVKGYKITGVYNE